MNVIACIHRVPDPDAHFRLAAGGAVELDAAPWMLDPVDAAAIEAGVTLPGSGGVSMARLSPRGYWRGRPL